MVPVSVSDHGKILDCHSAVPSGFTWKKTVLMPRLFNLSSLSRIAACCWITRCILLLALIELIGGQSRRDTVASQTPRIGSLFCWVLPVFTPEGVLTGVFESQLTRNSAAAISAAAFFVFDIREKLKELRVIGAVIRVIASGKYFRTIHGEVNQLATVISHKMISIIPICHLPYFCQFFIVDAYSS